MIKKLIDFLLDEDVVFGEVTNEITNFTLYGKANTIREKVFGNNKEAILKKMLTIKKEHLKISKLFSKKDFVENFKKGEVIISLNKLYKFKFSQFMGDIPTNVVVQKGIDIIKELYFSEYFYMDINSQTYDYDTDCSSFKLLRNDKEINWNIWGRYKKLILTF